MTNLILLLLVAFLAASGGVAVKIGLESFSPFFFVFLRYLFAFLLILPLLKKHSLFNLQKSKKLYLASFFAVTMVVLFAFGIQLTTIINSSIISPTTPILVGLISHLLFKARYRRNEIVGAALGLFGTLFIVFLPVFQGGQAVTGKLLGNFLLIGSSLSFALYSILSKSLHDKFSKKEITANFFLMAWVSQLVLMVLALLNDKPLLSAPLTLSTVLALIFAVINAVAFYVLFQRLIARAGAVYASFEAYIKPLMSTLLAMMLLSEKPTLGHFVGAIITFFGVWLYGRKK